MSSDRQGARRVSFVIHYSSTPRKSQSLDKHIPRYPNVYFNSPFTKMASFCVAPKSAVVGLRPAGRTATARRTARLAVRAGAINPDIKKDEPKVVDTLKSSDIKGKVGSPFSVYSKSSSRDASPAMSNKHVAKPSTARGRDPSGSFSVC